jgi:hypothetical protein
MSAVAEFTEVGIEGDPMRSEEMELVGEGVEFLFDAIKFVVQVRVSLSQATLPRFLMGMKFADGLELADLLERPSFEPRTNQGVPTCSSVPWM